MKPLHYLKRNSLFLVFLFALICGIFFRIYNLSWGAPFFFHPDERNIAYAITKLSVPTQLNPHFFAYGSLPIYTTYFTGVFLNLLQSLTHSTTIVINTVSFEQSILIGRGVSLLLSFGLLFLIYKITFLITNKLGAISATILASFSTGLIQYAHFATFEMWISFFSLLLCFLLLQYVKTKKLKYFFLCSGAMGFLLSTKVSTATLIPIVLLTITFTHARELFIKRHFQWRAFEKLFLLLTLAIAIIVTILILTSPFFWIDNSAFRSSIDYESSVALGTLPVFYTQGFTNTIPFLYQSLTVYPFILNPFVFLLFIGTLPFIIKKCTSLKNYAVIIVTLFFLVTLLSQTFLFVKWTRYYIPTLPFIYILLGIFFSEMIRGKQKKWFSALLYISIVISLIFSGSYFKTAYFAQDTRVSAAEWAHRNISKDAPILSEIYDLGIVPFNPSFPAITLYNFYELDTIPTSDKELKNLLSSSQYIILPSQRILKSRMLNYESFPKGYRFYSDLYNETGTFKKIYQTPCDIFCNIAYLGNPLFGLEETANVFDRPTIFIYEKKNN